MVNGASPAETLAGGGGSSDACSFVDACTDKDPETRAHASAALAHPFISSVDEHAGSDALQAWVQSVWRGTTLPTPGSPHPAHTSEAKARVHPVLERRKSAGDVSYERGTPIDAVSYERGTPVAAPLVAARQRQRGGGAFCAPPCASPRRVARSAPAALLSKEDVSPEKQKKTEVADKATSPVGALSAQTPAKKVVAKMEAPSPRVMMDGSLATTPRKVVERMEVPAILGEGSLDKPRGMSDLLTVLKSAILAN